MGTGGALFSMSTACRGTSMVSISAFGNATNPVAARTAFSVIIVFEAPAKIQYKENARRRVLRATQFSIVPDLACFARPRVRPLDRIYFARDAHC